MPKISLTIASILTVFAVSAVTSASALATPQYMVEGAEFHGTESVESTLKPSTKAVFKSKVTGGATIEISCESMSLSGATIMSNSKDAATAIIFKSCTNNLTCGMSSTLTSSGLVSEQVDVGTTGVEDLYSPTAGSTLITLTLTGCPGEGIYHVEGTLACEELEPSVEAIKKGCNFTTGTKTLLKFGPSAGTFTANTEVFLSGTKVGQKWHVRH